MTTENLKKQKNNNIHERAATAKTFITETSDMKNVKNMVSWS